MKGFGYAFMLKGEVSLASFFAANRASDELFAEERPVRLCESPSPTPRHSIAQSGLGIDWCPPSRLVVTSESTLLLYSAPPPSSLSQSKCHSSRAQARPTQLLSPHK